MLIKLLISIYISAVLFFAGMAHAAQTFQIALHSTQQLLPITFFDYDSELQTLHIQGKINNSCLQNFSPTVRLNKEQTIATLYVEAEYEQSCLGRTKQKDFNIFINLNSLLSKLPPQNKLKIKFLNTSDNFGDNVVSLHLNQLYHFTNNKEVSGRLIIKNNKAFVANDIGEIEVVAQFDLSDFEGKNVRLKGFSNTYGIMPVDGTTEAKILFSQISLF